MGSGGEGDLLGETEAGVPGEGGGFGTSLGVLLPLAFRVFRVQGLRV